MSCLLASATVFMLFKCSRSFCKRKRASRIKLGGSLLSPETTWAVLVFSFALGYVDRMVFVFVEAVMLSKEGLIKSGAVGFAINILVGPELGLGRWLVLALAFAL